MDETGDWAPDPALVDRVFGGRLAGMTRLGWGEDAAGGGWEAWVHTGDARRAPRLIARPPQVPVAMIGLLSFGVTDEVGYTCHITRVGEDLHQVFAVSAGPGATRVVVLDRVEHSLEVTPLGTHPDGSTRLFAGSARGLGAPHTITAFNASGERVAERRDLGEP